MTDFLKNPIFTDETKAREWLEARVWPQGPVCPHCGSTGDDVTKMEGKAHRPGLFQCKACREQFTVTVKTVFERSKIPLSKWLAALFLMVSSKKGVSAHQVHRMLGISYKSTWFMMHRLREAMRTGGLEPLGGEGKSGRGSGACWPDTGSIQYNLPCSSQNTALTTGDLACSARAGLTNSDTPARLS